ncbi:hypothetical protein [Nocardia sp. alder85J]|uniref:hypothetical protein n=1 Tax=Nocardia sp. alder85J TaxID=2862949 RepID=UPI001CD4BB26|nr:hypothetical protein [Nocardia sp. alder85J]MCX4093969.1 hypothetical protein [Nocardia sp. alder85J]
MDKSACRRLADGLGTAGQDLQTLGRGGAIADTLTTGLPGTKTPAAYHLAAREADRSLTAVGTALLELGGAVVSAIVAVTEQDSATAAHIAKQATR